MMARDKNEDKLVAIKFMPKDLRHKSKFEKEVAVFDALMTLNPYPAGFPGLIAKGKTNYFYYYIMEKLGKCLKKVHNNCKSGKMDLKTVINVGLQLVDRLEVLHSVNLVSTTL
jgi:casein kinase I family protein HRR25